MTARAWGFSFDVEPTWQQMFSFMSDNPGVTYLHVHGGDFEKRCNRPTEMKTAAL